jgi:hypothetical protein
MKGLEPTTFCMANARDRSRPFAPVRSSGQFAGVSAHASERERTRANIEPCHPCHGIGRRSRRLPVRPSRDRRSRPGSALFGGDRGELLKQAATLPLAGKEAEVAPEQQDRVEALVTAEGVVERSEPTSARPAAAQSERPAGRRRSRPPRVRGSRRCRPTRPAPQPRSSTRPRTNLIARRSCDHHDRNGAR